MTYPNTELFINGQWRSSKQGQWIDVLNPATEEVIGKVAKAGLEDLDEAISAANSGFSTWKKLSIFDRSKMMRKAALLLREQSQSIGQVMSLEQGKPAKEATLEILAAADVIDWFADEGRRAYGRLIPSRSHNIQQSVIREPIGVVAAFTPWNFPVNQALRKISAALAAGCSIIVKGPEETPASCALMVKAFAAAGIPQGVINLVYGNPPEVSSYLIAHPGVRKVSFTGSTAVGKQLAALAGQHMKPITMELGGHAPVIIFDDIEIDKTVATLAAAKFRNAGQVCVSPTRFLLQQNIADEFIQKFTQAAQSVPVGSTPESKMGPLANSRRVEALESLISDAVDCGAQLQAGGKRMEGKGYFFEPTVLTDVPTHAKIMNEEPFGPVVPINRFTNYDDAITEANRLPYGLAAFAFTQSGTRASQLSRDIESGMVSINHLGLGLPEVPFGGIKDSGIGTEGGADALEPYFISKFVTHLWQ